MSLYQVLSLAVPFVVRLTVSYKNAASDLYMSVNIRERHCDIIAQDQSLSTAICKPTHQPTWFEVSTRYQTRLNILLGSRNQAGHGQMEMK